MLRITHRAVFEELIGINNIAVYTTASFEDIKLRNGQVFEDLGDYMIGKMIEIK
jgi:hypothetical protein